jgi:hypothetical protein
MSKSTPKFPAYVHAVKAQEEAAKLVGEVRSLEGQLADLKMDSDLSPTEAARAFVRKEDDLKLALRQARLALSHADPDTSPHWRSAVSEMRTSAAPGIEADLQELEARCATVASRLLAPIIAAGREETAAANSTLVAAASGLTAEFRQVFFDAVNGSGEGIAARATALHDLIEAIPARIKDIEALADSYDAVSVAVQARLTDTVA